MTLFLSWWIFTCGLLLHVLNTSASENSTTTESSLLNLVIESSSNATFDKQLKTTTENVNHSLSNNVNSGSLYSSSGGEECKLGDCLKNSYTTSDIDSTSSPSKSLWNRVSTVKSTTSTFSGAVETNLGGETTTPSVTSVMDANYSNHSKIHNASFHSNGNELDSEISNDSNVLDNHYGHSGEVVNKPFSTQGSNISIPTTPDTVTEFGEILDSASSEISDVILDLDENSTLKWDVNKTLSENLNISNYSNLTDSTTVTIQDVTTQAEDELDFTTHFSDYSYAFDSNSAEEFPKDINSHIFDNSTEMPYREHNVSLDSEHNESSPDFSVSYDSSTESQELEVNNTETMTTVSPELTTSYHESNGSGTVRNNTAAYFDYDTSLESEEMKSADTESIHSTNTADGTNTTATPFDTSDLWDSEEMSNETSLKASIYPFISNEFSSKDLSTLSSEKQDNSSEDIQLNENESSENISSSYTQTTDKLLNGDASVETTESSESVDYIFNFTQETAESRNHIYHTPNYTDDSLGITVNATHLDSTTDITYSESTEMVNLNLSQTDTVSMGDIFPIESTDKFSDITNDSSVPEFSEHNTSVFASNMETETSTKPFSTSPVTTNTDPNLNVVYVNTVQDTSTQDLNNLNEIDDVIPSDSKLGETSSINPAASSLYTTMTSAEETSFEKSSATSHMYDYYETNPASDKVLTSPGSLLYETLTSRLEPRTSLSPSEYEFATTENTDKLLYNTEGVSVETLTQTASSVLTNNPEISSSTESVSREYIPSIINENASFYHSAYDDSSEVDVKHLTTSEKEAITKAGTIEESETVTVMKHYDSVFPSSTHEKVTSPTSAETSSVTETYREGKHIPFSSTLFRSTTQHPRIINITLRKYSHTPQPETTEDSFENLLYNQIKAEELSLEERSNLINAVVKFSENSYSKEDINKRIAVIHLWLLHAIADEFKNTTLSASGSNNGKFDEIEFENLPQIVYVLPTPEVYLPNISFTFVVHNTWRNVTFPADIILTILNLHTENLKHVLVDIDEIHFSQGLLVSKHDLLAIIINEYGTVLVSTCVLTVTMILLLILVVIFYRRKTRHSAHCLTDDKLHRNMQESMGIDLNPAVIILQDEIREKAALNGNKICSLDDDEGWLAPIGDVPVEDNNAPFVQDTKL